MQFSIFLFHFSVIYAIIAMVIYMLFQEFAAVMRSDVQISRIYAVQQRWDQKLRGADLLDAPRRSHGFLLLTDSSATYTLPDGSCLLAEPGDVLLLPKDAQYAVSFQLPPGGAAHPLLINARISCADGTEPLPDFPVTRLCKDDGTLLPLFMEAAELYKSGNHPALLKAVVYRLVAALFPVAQADECCIGYIKTHFTERFSIPALAKRCALSESVYRRRFHQLTGQSPIQYISRLKIEKACQLLQSGDITPGQVSDFLNFHSISYFYRVFKASTGYTPNEYRNRT